MKNNFYFFIILKLNIFIFNVVLFLLFFIDVSFFIRQAKRILQKNYKPTRQNYL